MILFWNLAAGDAALPTGALRQHASKKHSVPLILPIFARIVSAVGGPKLVRGVTDMRLLGHHVALPIMFLVLCDLCLFLVSLLVAVWVYPAFARAPFTTGLHALPLALALASINLACLLAAGLYKRNAVSFTARLSLHSATAMTLFVVASAAFLILYSWAHGQRFTNLYAVALSAACLQLILSFFVRALVVDMFDVVGLKRRLLLLGEGSVAAKVETWLAKHDPGYTDVVHYDSLRSERIVPLRWRSATVPAQVILPDLPELARHHRIDEIIVAESEDAAVWELLECRTRGVNVIDFLTFWEREAGRIDLDAIEPSWLVYSGGFRSSLLRRISQRSVDILISLVGLALMAPCLPIIAVLIWIDSKGPIFYRQERIGKDERPFQLLKFRSMHFDAEPDNIPQWAQIEDPRVTRVGKILRGMRIDEIPQLLNVLKGDMSLVGPRPERPIFVHTFRQKIPFYGVRHLVRPGITGWAQINYEYTASLEDTKRKLEYDLFYVKNQNLFLNLAIILQTIRIVLWQQGAR
jgi:sugar transferase (PEP-CTERM system associated)